MKFKNIANRSLAIYLFFILILNLIFLSNVSAELYQFDEDGVAYNEFENSKNIELVNCSLSEGNGSIILEYAPHDIIYDHQRKPNNVEAWYKENLWINPAGSGGNLGQFLSRYISPDLLDLEEFENLAPINKKGDTSFLESVGTLDRILFYTYYPIQLFKIKIDEDFNDIQSFEVDWWPGPYDEDANLKEISMFVWSPGDLIPKWNEIGKLTYNYDNISKYSIKENLSGKTFLDKDDGSAYILIIGKPDPEKSGTDEAILTTDYVKIKLFFTEGYNSDGYVISNTIEPTKFQGWESIIWDSSKPTEDTYIKLQILDENEDVIESFEGNSDGFLNSPVDISSLDPSYDKIKLKAILHSDKIQLTPYLYKWVVLWQTTDGFLDSFNFSFRIKEKNGLKIQGGTVTISEFFSEWPIYGKNPTNTRSYSGKQIKYKGNDTYWQTFINKDIAGWFKTPVMKDGLVYVGANDKKIYAYNLTISPGDDESEYPAVYESGANYEIETGLAVTDKYVIGATSELDSVDNKIFALNKTNLSEVIWEYENNNDNPICFSSSPTVSNGKVFVTSWSGKYATIPKLSYLFDKLNVLLRYNLVNNKLIALDENTGNLIWEQTVNLPAGSLSTPAVDDGVVYIGCDNLDGPSIFAFNEYDGREIWNNSIGPVGRSSPVVVQGDDHKIVLYLVREQSLLSFNGTDKIFALNAEDGSILWNQTVGNKTSVIGNFELRFYNFSNLRATSQPAATPAVYGDTVYVMASNGEMNAFNINNGKLKWTFGEASSFTYNSASPIVVGDIVYMFTQSAHLYGLDTDNGNKKIDFKTEYDYGRFVGYMYASPIITDGLVVVSIIEWTLKGDFYGHLLCFGDYEENINGNIYSIPLHVQKGKWWNTFSAKTENTEENNTIIFSIIDESGKKLMTGLNGTNNDISDIEQNTIQLCAEYNIIKTSEPYPLLKSWAINWSIEDKSPIFINSSFRAGDGQEGWVNLDIEECSIDVKDYGVDDVISGLDTDSAKYTLEYITTSDKKVTKTFDAICDGKSGDNEVKVIAEISELDIKFKEIENISFEIKDLAGNKATSEKISFKIDTVEPISEIKDADDYNDKYNSEILISAEGDDDKSGIASISLYFREVDTEIWVKYGSSQSPYNWSFENDTSNYYEFCTIAQDKAGNKEEFPDEGQLSFLFDMNLPTELDFEEVFYFNSLPTFKDDYKITFEDDFQIDLIEYRLIFHSLNDWTIIKENVGEKTYSKTWSLTQDDWEEMDEDRQYQIFFRITDLAGNVYEIDSTEDALIIVKDITPPQANVYFNVKYYKGGWDDTFTLTAMVSEEHDFDYIVLEYSYSSDNKKWEEWEEYGDELDSEPYSWDFEATDGNGYYKFRTKLFDNAGNYIESDTETVSITIFPTALLSIMIVIVLFFFIITFFVIIKIRKNKQIK